MSATTRNSWIRVAAIAAALVVAVVGFAVLVRDDVTRSPQPSASSGPTIATTTATTPSTPYPAALDRLLSLLPTGYPAGTCKPDGAPLPGATVSVTCGQNTDPGGPAVSTYALFSDLAGLGDAFAGFMDSGTVVACPDDKASPGKWWHLSDPKTILGPLACATREGGVPQVMWTNQHTKVFALVRGTAQGPGLGQLYKWWTAHS
jgi:serine/threonine kinase PknH